MKKKYKFLAGFTLIELLVVVAIIGLLSSIITVGFSNARIKSRDTRRVTDLKQIKSGLDIYFSHGSGYPTDAVWDANVGQNITCQGQSTLTIPRDPSGGTYQYDYTAAGQTTANGCGSGVDTRGGYQLQFYIENKNAYYIMDEEGKVRDTQGNPVGFDDLI